MEPRQLRGMEIAATQNLKRKGKGWEVPSQSGHGKYTVVTDEDYPRCTCPDYQDRLCKCKHIFAVEFAVQRTQNKDGSTTVTETVTLKATKQTTYPQNWPAYNAAQTNEKREFQVLLSKLCGTIETPPQTNGRPRLSLRDVVFATTFKVYSTVSGRRFISDLSEAHGNGYLTKLPHFNSIFNYLENPLLTPILTELIVQSSLPLKAVEVDFAVDSTGFTSSKFVRWFDHKYGVVRQEHDWVKCHLMTGVKTNVVTAVEIRDRDASDTKLLPPMLDVTCQNFKVSEVSADKGYSSINNTEVIAAKGATPFIAFKSIHTGKGGGLWEKMFHYFQFKRDEFMAHYHKRSNVESTFSMIKAKFGSDVRSKTETAMKNEVLCKILAHNICVLIQSMYELGIVPQFALAA